MLITQHVSFSEVVPLVTSAVVRIELMESMFDGRMERYNNGVIDIRV